MLQADALVTVNSAPAKKAKDLVPLAQLEALTEDRADRNLARALGRRSRPVIAQLASSAAGTPPASHRDQVQRGHHAVRSLTMPTTNLTTTPVASQELVQSSDCVSQYR